MQDVARDTHARVRREFANARPVEPARAAQGAGRTGPVPLRSSSRRGVPAYSAAIFGSGIPSTGQPETPMVSRVTASTISCALRGFWTQLR